MSTDAKYVEFHRQLKLLEIHKKEPAKSKLRPRDLIKIRMRCRLCGRARAVYRKFGCAGSASATWLDGLIPGVQKAAGDSMMTDPIADMLTRIRNSNRNEAPAVTCRTRSCGTAAQVLGRGVHPRPGRQDGADAPVRLTSPVDAADPKKTR